MMAQPKSDRTGTDNQVATATGRAGGYASASIIERRRRILSAARKLIEDKGLAEFNMDEVAEKAQVARRTIYNAFDSREQLVSAAIQQYFESFESRIAYRTAPATPERLVEHLSIVARRNLAVRDYTRTLLSNYFSSSADADVRQSIFEIAAHSHRPWIERLSNERQLHPWIEPKDLIDDLVRYRYSVGLDWALGRIEDNRFAPVIIVGVLTMVAGASKQRTRREVEAILADWRQFVPASR